MKKLRKTDLARKTFKNKGFSYSNIGSKEIGILIKILKIELAKFNNNGFRMTLQKVRKKDIEFNEDGTLKKCFLNVNGYLIENSLEQLFKDREAISFNTPDKNGNHFIGFAGWSSSANEKPFLTAFYKFMNTMENKR